ncbi:hypothetical protein GCK72_004400 [Caenorhabditis remanei]|uniref:F-box domain-containing protein n=1 Tax=Caenorhabditis remanei TaxID=31234 RepID=A0A6A5HDQ7_CAERE|nr:hypothetical protein GCK72_004400 [Caenorhabditis remanei]KAF1764452.1 hypothetical protein GCK72_004400 [Caenorhabditis remanei]
MPVIPVQYESLKAILPYLDPNTRFRISLRMPSISSLERRLPLKIENLKFSHFDSKVNKFSYRIGLYLDYGHNEIPCDVYDSNCSRGSSNDIDQYGFTIYPGVNNVLPGDIDLRKGNRRTSRNDSDRKEQYIVQRLRIYKMVLAEKLNQEYIEDDETRRIAVGAWDPSLEVSIRRSTATNSIEEIQSAIETIRWELKPFNNRRDNSTPPYTPWIQLSVNSPKGITIQRVRYKKYLHEAEKIMHTKLFGNRSEAISVKNLKVDLDNRILRFPAGAILKIENLEVSGWSATHFECLKSIIDPSSLPIQQLKMKSSPRAPDFRHNIVKESQTLIIDNRKFDNSSWTPILLNLANRRVYLMNENARNPPNDYVDLIENWLETGRPVGTTFSMGIKNEETVKQCLDTLRQRQEVLGLTEKQVKLRINALLMIDVSYETIEHSENSFTSENASNLWLRLKVVRRRPE